ncbi:hypothetical protein B9J09_08500 [Xylella fastidiosa subsp. pauca]|uniref:hypothetical protein n=1 Tax=Xylella fastidiosa TaxID=2371 RepID=UPI0005830D61|nr:hypothetical protein [Xylella fastidiosa]ARO68512.1 hypothetical protein B9J09_05270 [Xylella fastidiosa subsp. pauca]ARO68528.1 hypothetical protein B9J09_05350 [Xylella fastidiosa subsp. pauca]ARO68543.1 hypothetical protein B9J09_05425 [Xylella fastidiosa subsp. pauca]ARO68558.1 hypothetical protein B9J09_05500 [Xylella fastidiosa subsp. pauca]ARO69055.1 hypothetical protein B9J09_08500 [Xylella fastidiosa subsp. pauca]
MRITDTERGARMALNIAEMYVHQLDLWPDSLPQQFDFWLSVRAAALDQLDECYLLRRSLL